MRGFALTTMMGILSLIPTLLWSQSIPVLQSFPSLPDPVGMAGMFAGISNGQLFCMGGANFPDKKPWEGGKKVWQDGIYWMNEQQQWVKLEERMPSPLAYGVSVQYQHELIMVGGNDENEFHKEVVGLTWNGHSFDRKNYPDLPVPLANMAGAMVGSTIVVAGGNSSFTGTGLSGCYALDLKHLRDGWVQLPSWPGPARNQPVGGSFGKKFYLFGGEAPGVDKEGNPQRVMLLDAYRLSLKRSLGILKGTWEVLPSMPKSVVASANPVPVNSRGAFLFWGGVDSIAAKQKNPAIHPGNDKTVMSYSSRTSEWKLLGTLQDEPAPVTLPSVLWKGYWLYISGEVRPGVRTNSIRGFKNN